MPRIKVDITHPDRLLFPADGITKGELVDYYAAVAEVMVPHMKGRPLTLWRYPRGIDQQGFVQQDFAGTLPDWMGSAEVAKEGGTVVHPVADRRESVVWLANQNCVTPHCWLSRRDRLEEPDQIVFDLDPSTSDFAAVRATARACADVLDDLGMASYLKSTGSRGLHVVVPISRGPDFDTARQFARYHELLKRNVLGAEPKEAAAEPTPTETEQPEVEAAEPVEAASPEAPEDTGVELEVHVSLPVGSARECRSWSGGTSPQPRSDC